MAWRIDSSILAGEFDFTVRGIVTGTLQVWGRETEIKVQLEGLPWADLAGHRLRFVRKAKATRPSPLDASFVGEQSGTAGDMTASRKVKILDRPVEEILHLPQDEIVWHWGNCLYLEWYSERNGRVVLESTDFDLMIDPVGAWQLAPEDAPRSSALSSIPPVAEDDLDSYLPDDDEPESRAELEADREAARMDRLLDCIGRRMDREGARADFAKIMEEERERLRIELGEPEPEPPTPEEEAEHARWIEEANAAAEEALAEAEEDPDFFDDGRHPLVERASSLGLRLWQELVKGPENEEAFSQEHPFLEIANGTMFAGATLAGALGGVRREEWPPDSLFAGHVLVRLKKARSQLRDALSGVRSAESDGLLGGVRLDEIEGEVRSLLEAVEVLIAEVREVLG